MSGIGKTRNCVETRRQQSGVFSLNFEFFQFPRVDIQLYQHEWNWKNEKLCGNTTPAERSVFTKFRVFPISTSVDITVYQHRKKCFIYIYNTKKYKINSMYERREIFHVYIELCKHGS